MPRLEDVNNFLCPLTGFKAKAVSGYVPAGVPVLVVTLSIEDEVGVLDAGLKVRVASLGSPATLHVTEPL